MKRLEFLYGMKSPLPNAVMKKWPNGNVVQLWGENPALYSAAAGRFDDFHTYVGGHMGIDIATKHRDPVYAAHDGIVTITHGSRTGQGGLEVWLTSPDLDDETPGNSRVSTVYCHLDEYVVKVGNQLKQGDLIGYEGNTGFVVSGGTTYWGNAPAGKGTHLHFGLYEYKKDQWGNWQARYVNVLRNTSEPLQYLTETPENPYGDLSGFAVVLNNAAAYLAKLRGW